jgi:hypothetical protein
MVVEFARRRWRTVTAFLALALTSTPLVGTHSIAGAVTEGVFVSVSTSNAVLNRSTTPIPAGMITLYLDRNPITDSSALASWVNPDNFLADDDLGTLIDERPIDAVSIGTSSSAVEFQIPAASLNVGSDQSLAVYGISARFTTASSEEIAQGRSTLVWQNGIPDTTAEFTVITPVTTPPTSVGLISAAALETFTSPNGLLTRQLAGVINRKNVAIAIDPMIIASIRVLGSSAPKSAQEWLGHLSHATNETFALSYADSDLAVQFQAGQSNILQPISFSYAVDPGNFEEAAKNHTLIPSPTPSSTPTEPAPSPAHTNNSIPSLESLSEFEYSLSGIAWPGENTVTSETLESLTTNGYSTTILDGENITPTDTITSGLTNTNGASTLVTNHALDVILRRAINARSDTEWRMAMSTASAQLALMSTQDSTTPENAPHSIIATLGREWPASSDHISSSIATLNQLPWVTPTTLTTQLAQEPTESTLRNSPEAEKRVNAVSTLINRENTLAQFSTVIENPDQLTGPERNNMLALLANSWTSKTDEWTQAISDHEAATTAQLNAIEIAPSSDVTQVGVEASIPITVANKLNYPAVVVLQANPNNGRLHVQSPIEVSIESESRKTVRIPATARIGNGEVTLSVDIFTPTGVHITGPSLVSVNVQADWEGIGAIILAVLVVGFFGFGLFRTIRRRRRERNHLAASSKTSSH